MIEVGGEQGHTRGRERVVVAGIIALAVVVIVAVVYYGFFNNSKNADGMPRGYDGGRDEACNIAGIGLYGDLITPVFTSEYVSEEGEVRGATVSDEVVLAIEEGEGEEAVKGYLLEIDSYGGLPVAGEEIAMALERARKPSVAVIRQAGLSAAYWAALGADRIFASENSDIGSIGATASYLYQRDPDAQFVELNSAKFKDTGSPEKPITAEDRALILRDLKIIHENFVRAVANYRKLPVASVESVADGSSVLGSRAKALGLIDDIGSWPEAERYLESQIGEKPVVCW